MPRLLAALLALVWIMPASARDLGQWDEVDPATRAWFSTVKMPDVPTVSCCGEADAYWADQTEVKDGKLYATVTDERPDGPLGRNHVPVGTRIEVPPHKVQWRFGNPTGHTVLFLSGTQQVYCFIGNDGS